MTGQELHVNGGMYMVCLPCSRLEWLLLCMAASSGLALAGRLKWRLNVFQQPFEGSHERY